MTRKWFGITALILTAIVLLSLSSCARNQQLQGITVSPSTVIYDAAVPTGVTQVPVQLTAYGLYIHPEEKRNIPTSVTWFSNIALVATVDSSGNLTAGPNCGVANISANSNTSGNVNDDGVAGFVTVTVLGPPSLGCLQGDGTNRLSVIVTGGTNGLIVSSPAGINCGTTCPAPFATGSTVVLTPTPNSGHAFGGWGEWDVTS